MRIVGITKVRNESAIIKDTLDHFGKICDGIIVYDDASDDDTAELCAKHPAVLSVLRGSELNPDRMEAEYQNRQKALEAAQAFNPDWILCFDADERVDMPSIEWDSYDGVVMKLYDFYITPEDKDLPYTERTYIDPYYREILMLFRNLPGLSYRYRDQREMKLPEDARITHAGEVRHYGKAISVEEWEKTCDYYSTWPEPYGSKWCERKGRAVHTLSDSGEPLVEWNERSHKTRKLL